MKEPYVIITLFTILFFMFFIAIQIQSYHIGISLFITFLFSTTMTAISYGLVGGEQNGKAREGRLGKNPRLDNGSG